MSTQTFNPQQLSDQPDRIDGEAAFTASLCEAMLENGISTSRDEVINFYVALKSKPLVVLAGPAKSGKNALVQGIAQSLVERESLRVQIFTGHPWWATRCDDIAGHTSLHTRFSTEKILSIIEEAGQPGNARQVFVACLTQISPAELLGFFTEVAFQLQHGQIMRLGDTHLSEPVSFPANLRIIGTMDTSSFDWWDSDLLLNTTVIQWRNARVLSNSVFGRCSLLEESEFLRSCIRGRDVAYHKIVPVLKSQRQPLYPLLRVEAALKKYVSVLELATDEVMIYLANSWSRLGCGLFHPNPDRNLAIALDLAIAQILLPRAADAIRNLETLRNQLRNILTDELWRSAAFVDMLGFQDK
jgi:hypothetical protein